MKLTVLVDNNTIIDRYLTGEPALSFLIEDRGTKVLFDVGYSDAFLKNAAVLGISLLDVDYIVLSHGHFDHTWGLEPLIRYYTEAAIEKREFKRPELIAHPLTFKTKKMAPLREIGSLLSEEKLTHHFDITLTAKPLSLTDNLVFLGEIKRRNNFEAQKPLGKIITDNSGAQEDDYLLEDSALVYKSPEGMVIITGCSHAGICNIVDYAKEVCNEKRVIDIIGGFHLLDPSKDVLRHTLNYMKKLKPLDVHACHCTDLQSKIALAGVVSLKEVGSGLCLEFK